MPLPAAERKHLRQLASGFKDTRILIIGDLMLDNYIRGGVSRISPEAPVPVVSVNQETFVPGGAGNVAANLSSLEAKVNIMAVVGDDEAATRLFSDMTSRHISSSDIIVDKQRVTSQKCRVVADRQQIVRFDRETSGPLSHATEKKILERLPRAIGDAQAVILSDYGKGMISAAILQQAISICRRRGIPITVDPKIEHFKRYRKITCMTPNLHEAWAGMHRPPKAGNAEIEKLGKEILKTLKSDSVLITRGADGMSIFEPGNRVTHIPTQAREVFDVTGAGDTVIAVLTLALARGASIKRAALIANYAAGIVVGKLGTAVTNIEEIKRALA